MTLLAHIQIISPNSIILLVTKFHQHDKTSKNLDQGRGETCETYGLIALDKALFPPGRGGFFLGGGMLVDFGHDQKLSKFLNRNNDTNHK